MRRASRPISSGITWSVKVARHRQLAAVQRRVTQTGDAVLGGEFQGDEIAARAADDDLAVDDFHARSAAYDNPWAPDRDRPLQKAEG